MSSTTDNILFINDSIAALRNAIFTPAGIDKDITEGIAKPFLCYRRNDLQLQIDFSTKLTMIEINRSFELTKTHMENIYESSGYGWDDEEKMHELTEQGARFLLIRANIERNGRASSKLLGFVHFRFTVQGNVVDQMAGEPCLYIWDIQLDKTIQRKGVGRHLITLLELIARREKMNYVSLPIQNTDDQSKSWISKIRGFKIDAELRQVVGFNATAEGFEVYSKNLSINVRSQNCSRYIKSSKKINLDPINVNKSIITPDKKKEETTTTKFTSPNSVADVNNISNKNHDIKILEDSEAADKENDWSLSGISGRDVVEGLKVLFREKNNRDVTEDEVKQWLTAMNKTEPSVMTTLTTTNITQQHQHQYYH